MRKLVLLLVTLPSLLNARSVTGTVVSESTRKPLEMVNVLLLRSGDSTLVTGGTTNGNGHFELPDVPDGKYLVRLRLLGYIEKDVEVDVTPQPGESTALGTIRLTEKALAMDEVVVTSQKLLMNNSIDRKTYNVDQDILGKSGSASEVLQNIPSVEVDIDGNVSLRGSSNVLFLIDGKASPLLEKNAAVVLQQIPASSIERIEVMTNPPARYKPDGTSGIINIVMKKSTGTGWNGTVGANVGNDSRYNANLRLSYNPGHANLFGSYAYRKDSRGRLADGTETGLPPATYQYREHLVSLARPGSHLVSAGAQISFDKTNRAEIAGSYFRNTFLRQEENANATRNAAGNDTSAYSRFRHDDEYEDEAGVDASFQHTFPGEDHSLHASYKFSSQPEVEDNKYTNAYTLPAPLTTFDNMRIANKGRKHEIAIEYVNALAEGIKLEAGYGGEIGRSDFDFQAARYDPAAGAFIIADAGRSNRFMYDEAIHALYATIEFHEGIVGILAGVHGEESFTTANQVTRDSIIDRTLFAFYPTLHLSARVSDAVEFQLNYSRRTRRPDSEDLNPFPEYHDTRNISAGNADLRPEDIHSVELGMQWQNSWLTFTPGLYYRYTGKRMTMVTQRLNDSLLLTTRQNLSHDQAAGIEGVVSMSRSELFSSNLSANLYYNEIDASNLGFSNRKSTITWSASWTLSAHIGWNTMLQLNANYSARRLTPQGEYHPSYVVNLGMRKEMLDNRLAIICTIADLFKSVRREITVNGVDFTGWLNQKRDGRVFYCGLSYTFGSSRKSSKDEQLKYDNGL